MGRTVHGLTGAVAAFVLMVQAGRGATEAPVAVGVKVGTVGVGAEVTLQALPGLNLRGGGNYLAFDYDGTVDDIDYDFELDFQWLSALLDWHPFDNQFRISAGAFWSDNEVTLTGTPSESETIGDNRYSPAQLGTLIGTLNFDEVAPYVGVGYGNAVGRGQRWSFSFDLGVAIQSYDVTLEATGPVNSVPGFQEDLRKEEQDIQNDLDRLEVYPVLSFGIAYHF